MKQKPFLIVVATGWLMLLTTAFHRQTTVDHTAFDRLLKKHVNAKGLVDYKGFKADEAALDQYLAMLSRSGPTPAGSRADQMAFWINAYNAGTIKLILNHYPVKSIRDINMPGAATPWAAKFMAIGGTKVSLDHIEHNILRRQYNDPRVHFALVCASISCPRLRSEAYTADRLSAQLDEQGRDFLNNPAKNRITGRTAQLSSYFDWYKSDWTSNGQSVVAWVNRYSTTKIADNTAITYLDYNWALNDQ